MRERGIAFLLALAALAAFYGLWLRPAPSLDPDADTARPTTAERRGNGYAGLYEWLQRSGVDVRSLRERYTALARARPAAARQSAGPLAARRWRYSAATSSARSTGGCGAATRCSSTPRCSISRAGPRGRSSGAVVEIESLTAIEFETRKAREPRLDDTPLAQRVREADARDAEARSEDEDDEDDPRMRAAQERGELLEVPEKIPLTATGPHALLAGVRTLELETDYEAEEWSLRMPYDNFVLTLARTDKRRGRVVRAARGRRGACCCRAGGSLFTNRALGNDDNAQLFANIVSTRVSRDGVVLFDDLRQGLSASYDPARFYEDPRLYKTHVHRARAVAGLGAGFHAAARARHRGARSVRGRAGAARRRADRAHGRAVITRRCALFDQFFAGVARAARGAGGATPERGDLWHWLERHARDPAAGTRSTENLVRGCACGAQARRSSPLQNLLDTLEKRLKT